jgi:hypothetical protein
MTGSLPEALGDLEQLTQLQFTDNQINGPVPARLGGLKQLAVLALGANWIEGTIPAWLAGLKRLTTLSLCKNEFTGVVPSLPFKNYTLCALQVTTSTCSGCCSSLENARNRYSCPLPPVSPSRVHLTPHAPRLYAF